MLVISDHQHVTDIRMRWIMGTKGMKNKGKNNVHLTYCLTLQTLPTLIGVAPFAAAVVVGGAMPLIWGGKARPGSKMES